MISNRFISVLKLVFLVCFLVSLAGLLQYELNVKGHYENDPEAYERDSQKIISFIDQEGCVSVKEVSEEHDFGYLQARYLMSKMSKEKLVSKYEGIGVCLTLLGEAQIKQW